MMKKQISMALTIALLLSGCASGEGKDALAGTENQSEGSETTISYEEETGEDISYEAAEDEEESPLKGVDLNYILENNGSLSFTPEDLTEELSVEIYTYLITALKNLDFQAIAPLIRENSFEDLEGTFQAIQEDPVWLEIWNDYIGGMEYTPHHMLFTKDLNWIYSAWYTENFLAGDPIPYNMQRDFPQDYTYEIYQKYGKAAPYKVAVRDLGRDTLVRATSIEDGRMYIDLDVALFYSLDCGARLTWTDRVGFYIEGYGNIGKANLAAMVVGGDAQYLIEMGYESVTESVPDYEDYLNGDFEAIANYIEENLDEKYQPLREYQYFENYLLNEENRRLVQEYFDENCEFRLVLYGVEYIGPVPERYFEGEYAKDRDIILNSGKKLCYSDAIRRMPDDFMVSFEPLMSLLQNMEDLGILPGLY